MTLTPSEHLEVVATLWPSAPKMIGTQNATVVAFWQAEAVRLALKIGAMNTEALLRHSDGEVL